MLFSTQCLPGPHTAWGTALTGGKSGSTLQSAEVLHRQTCHKIFSTQTPSLQAEHKGQTCCARHKRTGSQDNTPTSWKRKSSIPTRHDQTRHSTILGTPFDWQLYTFEVHQKETPSNSLEPAGQKQDRMSNPSACLATAILGSTFEAHQKVQKETPSNFKQPGPQKTLHRLHMVPYLEVLLALNL